MIDSEIRTQTYQFFLEEAPELLQIIETNLLSLNQERNPGIIHDLMRAAHSIKGGAATVGLDALATIAHRLESIFRGLHCETITIDSELESQLLQAYDSLREPLQQQITTGSYDEDGALALAETVFDQIEQQLGSALQEAENYLPSSADLGVDIVSSIFTVDVSQGINHLAILLANPEDYQLAEELRSQAEVFAGFAEILNLPGFGAIANTALKALDLNSESVLEILPLALADFQAAREIVLAGDRTAGGSPSQELLAYAEREVITPTDFQPVTTQDDVATYFGEASAVLEAIATVSVPPEAVLPNPELETEIPTIDAVISEPETLLNSQADPSRRSTAPPSPSQTNTSAPPGNLKVKVDLARLEKMNNLVGELVINRNGLALQQEQLPIIIGKIQQRLGEFQNLTRKMPKIAHRQVPSSRELESLPQVASNPLTDFDDLEMERYRHDSISEVQEEMMQLEEAVEDLTLLGRQLAGTIKNQQQTLTKLRDELMWARMLPLEKVLSCFPRSLRDLSYKYGKPVDLVMSGTEILVDKGILEKLHNPLLHLIRNAFDHGIEASEIRRRQGKPEQGKIEIRAIHQGNRTVIEISDDGGGLDLSKIARRAIDRGWLRMEQLTRTTEEQLLDFIFEPGFSTAEQISEISGRGVGLDVVRSQLQEIKGTVQVTSTPGAGTTFTLSLPITLTIAKLLVCAVNSNLVALPVATIQEIILPPKDLPQQIGDQRVLPWREQLLPVYRLSELLDYHYPHSVNQQYQKFVGNSAANQGTLSMLIIQQEQQHFALEIEDFGTEQEMVIKPVTGAIIPPNYIYGCTVLGNGSLIPAIDASALLAYVQQQQQPADNTQHLPWQTEINHNSPIAIPSVLVVDDSAMMRRTLTLTLKKAGYRVLQARSGAEALELLQQNSQLELIVSDLEMPNLNGFEFLDRLRQSPDYAQIPAIMLTTRSNDKHRQLAMHLGAAAYLSKPYIEQEFLAVLQTIIARQTNLPSISAAA
ncbi:MAG: hybrid sensor histidine kinase/response regulator [Cyanobacteria bacterium P01_A01_bin.40]